MEQKMPKPIGNCQGKEIKRFSETKDGNDEFIQEPSKPIGECQGKQVKRFSKTEVGAENFEQKPIGERQGKEIKRFSKDKVDNKSFNIGTDSSSYEESLIIEPYRRIEEKRKEKEVRKNIEKMKLKMRETNSCIEDAGKVIGKDKDADVPLKGNIQLGNQSDSGKEKKLTMEFMAKEVTSKLPVIRHNNSIYYYTGRTYKIIDTRKKLLALIRSSVSRDAFGTSATNKFNDLLEYLEADERLIPDRYEESLDKSRYLVVLENGVLDLWNMSILKHSKKYLTFYELKAKWKEQPKPKQFLRFLQRVSEGDKEIEMRIVEVMGYLLSPVNEGKYFFVMGISPNSGKSTLGELLLKLLGDELVVSRSAHDIGKRFSLGNIKGKILNMSLDLPKGKLDRVSVSLIKAITGGDYISIEQKYKEIEDIHSNMRFLFASNYPVTIPEKDDDSFWDRMVILPFLYSIDKVEEDKKILNKLLEEKDDIISWCLQAFGRVLRNKCIFSECEAAEKMKDNWRYHEYDDTGTLQPFLDAFIEVTGNEKEGIHSKDAHKIYEKYCRENNCCSVGYDKFYNWFISNVEGCTKKRDRLGSPNCRASLMGIRWKENVNMD